MGFIIAIAFIPLFFILIIALFFRAYFDSKKAKVEDSTNLSSVGNSEAKINPGLSILNVISKIILWVCFAGILLILYFIFNFKAR